MKTVSFEKTASISTDCGEDEDHLSGLPKREASVLCSSFDVDSFLAHCKPAQSHQTVTRHDVDAVSMLFADLKVLRPQPLCVFLHPERTKGRFCLEDYSFKIKGKPVATYPNFKLIEAGICRYVDKNQKQPFYP
jgi:hypothetical protein